MYDVDGTLTGTAGAFVAANNPLLVTPACTLRPAWNAYVCLNRFVNLQVRSADQQTIAPLDVVRDDGATGGFVGVPDNAWMVSASVTPARTYTVSYKAGIPVKPQLFANGLAQGEWVRVVVPYPTGQVNVYRDYNTSVAIPAAASLAELDAGTGDKYYYDTGSAKLYFRLMAKVGRDWATMFVVPK
jgi:hypothetical protein